MGGGDAGAGRVRPGRGYFGEQVGDLTPEILILLEVHPFGLHDRRRLIEQISCRLGVGCHVTHPLPRMPLPARPGFSWADG
jgi:hypothetical protein